MKKLFLTILTIANTLGISAEGICYTRADSIKVVSLLTEGMKQDKSTNLMIYYGMKLRGIPYVAHTLEVNKKEQLVVNLHQLDCTTFVETVLALSLSTNQHSTRWKDYCANLTKIRYNDGKINGYPSRNHYFLWWVQSNSRQGIVNTPLDNISYPSFVRKQTIELNWMSMHSSSYSMLAGNKSDIARITAHEKESNGSTVLYVPATSTGLSESKLSFIHDGDILAIATNKKGLDTSHIGIAYWGKDGKLHLLNASQVHHKVILEPMTLHDYMKQHPSQAGIWVIHPNISH